MKVFRACIIIFKRRIASFALYFGIFITLSIVIPALSEEQFNTDFSTLKPSFTIINRDEDSQLTDGLLSYLRTHGNEVVLEDEKSALQDAAFFHATDYIVFLPPGFKDSFISRNHMTLEKVTTTATARGYYVDSMVNQYLNLARVYLAAGDEMSEEDIVSAVLGDLSLQAIAERKHFGEGTPLAMSYLIYSRMLPYILLVLNILCVTNIMMVFRRPDLRMRNLCTPLRPRSFSGQQILCCGLLSVMAWLLMSVTGFILYGSNLTGVDSRIIALILLNTLTFTFVALSIATLTGSFARGVNAQNAAANVVGLGLCFLGGVFVPLEFFGPGLMAVSRFLPTYWNVTALNDIGALTSFTSDTLLPIWQSILIQLAFAAAFFCVALVLSKHLNQSERSFGSVQTEIEA